MKKIILVCLLSVVAIASDWEYLIYVKGVEFNKKTKKMSYYSIINQNGEKIGSGEGKDSITANASMLKKYLGKWNYTTAYKMDVLRILGSNGWDLITIKGEINNSNQNYYFKRKK